MIYWSDPPYPVRSGLGNTALVDIVRSTRVFSCAASGPVYVPESYGLYRV